MGAQRLDDAVGERQDPAEEHAAAHAALDLLRDAGLEGGEHGLLELRPEPPHVAQAPALGGLPERVQ